jgi:very-short-patch-repair endonuclease/predicted transcriptional regulator of viral defense system
MPELCGSRCPTDTKIRRVQADREIAALAARQHGVVAISQLTAMGVSRTVALHRARSGLLVPLHRGVYAVGHRRLRREGFWLAAVLAMGPDAALSHRDAAALHQLRPANHERIEVTTPADRRGTRRIAVYPRRQLDPLDVTTVNAILVTSVARTLVDLADVLPATRLGPVVSEAERRGVFDLNAVEAALARTRHRRGRGSAALRAVLDEHRRRGTQLTRSELEERFAALVEAAGLPRPQTNRWIGDFEVDAVWPERRLAVELDGWAFHRDRHAFERDRIKANALIAKGWTVLRYTHDAVVRRPAEIAAQLAAMLAA